MYEAIIRTTVPIFLLIGTGLLSRRIGILKAGDERVLSAYVYYFALPALLLINMAETSFTLETIRFMLVSVIPVLIALVLYVVLYFVSGLSRKTFYLLILSTIFGSLAFFGIPFITFAFPLEGEKLATLSVASISIVSVIISITVLELYQLEDGKIIKGLRIVLGRLSRNPLILSIIVGILLSIIGIEIPLIVSRPLHMLGGTTSTVAIFMLGVFLYGRKYTKLGKAFKLSLLRIVFLPILAFLSTTLVGIGNLEGTVVVLMHGMPVAISMIILSERYNFHKETIASLILISSFTAGIYLNLWLFLLGQI